MQGAYGAVGLLSAACLVYAKLAVFSLLVCVIALASLSRAGLTRGWRLLLFISLALSCVGVGRFVFTEAVLGISEARGRDTERRAVSLLREIYFAQNAARRYAMIDPDGDGVGSAGFLAELTGSATARQGAPLPTPPLAPRLSPRMDTRVGQATKIESYLFIICLPTAEDGWTAQPSDQVDNEAAERSWLAYAWPSESGLPHTSVYVIDEHEAIFVHDNRASSGLRFVGTTHPPACTTLRKPPALVSFSPWQGKQPRADLPGAP
jgi:hypothetical protein